jgi:protein pelota
MRILRKDLKHDKITVMPENLDDLWVLEKILQAGDVVSGKTQRSIKISRGEQSIKAGRKTIFVKLMVESIEFSETQLRLKGRIIESSEGEHGYHTFETEPNRIMTIEREWRGYEIRMLEKARKKHPPILIVVLDDNECSIATLTQRLGPVTTIRGVSGKSLGREDKGRYLSEVLKVVRNRAAKHIIIAGPGFAKEGLMKLIKEKEPELAKKILMDTISHTGEVGIKEVLKRGMVNRVYKDSELGEQTMLIEAFFEALAKDGLVTYGPEHVKNAVEIGAVERLLVCDKLVRENQELIKTAEQSRSEVKIINTDHEAGQRLLSMGGLAAFLRYRVEY